MLNRKASKWAIIFIAFIFSACSAAETVMEELINTNLSAAGNYIIVESTIGDFTRVHTFQGHFTQIQEDIIFKSDADGILKSFEVSNRQFVEAGDVLAIIGYDTAPYTTALEKLRIDLGHAESDLQIEKEIRLKNISEISGEGQIAGIRMERAILEYELFIYSAGQRIDKLRQEIENILEKFEDVVIKAPVSGTVRGIILNPGAEVMANRPIMHIDHVNTLRFYINAAPGILRYNMEVIIETGGIKYPGRIVSNPTADGFGYDETSLTFLVDFDGGGPADVNTSAPLSVTAIHEFLNILTVPNTAVFNEFDRRYVQIFEDGAIKKRYVQIGVTTAGTVQIITGLKPGEILLSR